jgi:glutamate-1-semialdehyde 2,1-aminomutase
MSSIADGRYSHSGTYNANVVACAAVSTTMDLLAEPGLYQRQLALGQRLMDGLRDLAEDAGLPVIVEGLGTVFQLWFTEHPIRNWRDAERYARTAAVPQPGHWPGNQPHLARSALPATRRAGDGGGVRT